MSILDDLSISRKQARSIALANADASKSQINFWPGAVRSGKTIGSLVKFEMKLAEGSDLSGENVIISRTRDTAFRNLIAPMQDTKLFGHYAEYVKYNRGAPTAEIFGEMVHVIGASDVRAEATIRGMTIKRSYVDEWTLIAKDFTNMLVSRHSVAGAWCGGTSNPDGPSHYLKKDYMDVAAERGHRIFPFELEDNRANLPDGYIENLSAQYTGLWHDRFIKGLWTMADGVIYEAFDPAVHVVSTLPDMQRLLCVGVDYGDTNPTRGILLGLGIDNRLYAMAEWAPGKGTSADRSASLRAFLDEHGPVEHLFVDPAAAGFKFQLNRDGYTNVFNAANKVDDGIKVVASLFSTHQLLIHNTCTNLLKEIPGYVWDAKKSAKGEDAPVKLDDHACFVAGTPIETEGGPVPIESVTAGMRVHTRDGLRTVTAQSMTSPDAQVYDVHMSDGTTLTGTGNHPVWVHGHGWIRLDALRYSDRLEAWKSVSTQSLSRANASAATQTPTTGPTGATSLPESQTSNADSAASTKKSGWTPTESTPSPMAGTSTTRTTTPATTAPTTSKLSQQRNTTGTTPASRSPQNGWPANWNTSTASAASLRPGMEHPRGSHGTASTEHAHGRTVSTALDHVTSVEPSTTHDPVRVASGSARTPASPRPGERAESMKSTESALTAGGRSASTSTGQPGAAPVHVLDVCEAGRSAVYNLTVGGTPEYFASGVLVHNCDALRYAVQTSRPFWQPYLPNLDAVTKLPDERIEAA